MRFPGSFISNDLLSSKMADFHMRAMSLPARHEEAAPPDT